MFSLERFVTEKLPPGDTVPMSDIESVKKAWKTQIETVRFFFFFFWGGGGVRGVLRCYKDFLFKKI
jgi:hypothetical protein